MAQKDTGPSNRALLVISILIILGGAVYSGSSYYRFSQGLPPDERSEWDDFGPGDRGGRRGPGEFGRGDRPRGEGPGRGDRERGPGGPGFREEMVRELKITPEQQAQFEQLRAAPRPEGPDGWQERRQQFESILTPDQRQRMTQVMGQRMEQGIQRRLERARRILPPDQMRIYEQRLREMMERMRQRGGRGGRGGGPGGGPGMPPPNPGGGRG
ncbi:MAG: hypothetical protein HUU16_06955 [Candidatus Omnitrophica bacterium]|nr:hypothetical protein [Candidatus Omnitrophota bacterium]